MKTFAIPIPARALILAALVGALPVLHASAQAVSENPAAPKRPAHAQGPEGRTADPEGEDLEKSAPAFIGKADRSFVTKAATAGMYEIEASKLAEKRASDPRIRKLAQMLVKDHQAAHRALQAVSVAHNYPLPEKLPDDLQASIDKLSKMSGKEFDAAYRDEVAVKAHEDAIAMFKSASRATRTKDLKDWIDRQLPRLEAHLKQGRDLKA